MKFEIFANHDPISHFVEADSMDDAAKKLGIRIADEDEEAVDGRYHLATKDGDVYISFDEIAEVSSNSELVDLVQRMYTADDMLHTHDDEGYLLE